jgi:hypothetical protein
MHLTPPSALEPSSPSDGRHGCRWSCDCSTRYLPLQQQDSGSVKIPPLSAAADPMSTNPRSASFSPMSLLRQFESGQLKRENGKILRECEVTLIKVRPDQNESGTTVGGITTCHRPPRPPIDKLLAVGRAGLMITLVPQLAMFRPQGQLLFSGGNWLMALG